MPISKPRLGAGPDDTVRFSVNLVELRRAFRRILARLPDETEAGADSVAFNATANALQILVGETSEFPPASVLEPGRGTIPLSVFRGIARTLRFFRSGPIALSFSAGALRIETAKFRHAEISVQPLTTETYRSEQNLQTTEPLNG